MTSYVRGVLDLTLLVATLAGAAVGNGLPPVSCLLYCFI